MSQDMPPPKPPRGVFADVQERTEQPRQEDKRSRDRHSKATAVKGQFAGTDRLMDIVRVFRAQIGRISHGTFTGEQAIAIMLQYFQDHKEEFTSPYLDRETAINVLTTLMRTRVFAPSESLTTFSDSKRSVYTLLPESNFNLSGALNPPTQKVRYQNSVSPSSRSRQHSFKKLIRNTMQWGSRSGSTRELASDRDSTFSSEENVSTADALYYKAALQRLLLYIELPNLEGIANVNTECRTEDNVSYLSSILSKMGLAAARAFRRPHNLYADEETDECISGNRIARENLVAFFNTARILVPSIHLKQTLPNNDTEQCSLWTAQCLQSICTWLNDLTNGGQNPLIPMEFSEICRALAEQVLLNDRRWKFAKICLQYLVIMLPASMRKHLTRVIHWLSATRGTRDYCVIGPLVWAAIPMPQCLPFCDNSEAALQRVLNFITPTTLGVNNQTVLIKCFVDLFNEHLMGEVPQEIESAVASQELNPDLEDTPAVLFCEIQQQSVHDDCTNRELVKMMQVLLESPALTAKEKRQKLDVFKKSHESLYKLHFDSMTTSNPSIRSRKHSS